MAKKKVPAVKPKTEVEEEAEHDGYLFDNKTRNAIDEVPWKRAGLPTLPDDKKGNKWEKFVANYGVDRNRVVDDAFLIDYVARHGGDVPVGYMAERCAVHMWDYENNKSFGGRSILHMLLQEQIGKLIKTDHDLLLAEITACTIVQWLQTNVGQGFLHQVAELVKVEQERIQEKVPEHRKLLVAVGEISKDNFAHLQRWEDAERQRRAKRGRRNDEFATGRP